MLSRFQKAYTKKRRQLTTSSLYVIYVIFAIANLIRIWNTLSPVEVGLFVPGITFLTLAIGHGFGRAIQAVVEENRELADPNHHEKSASEINEENRNRLIRPSTHNIINNALHVGCSSLFIAGDLRMLADAAPIPASTIRAGLIAQTAGAFCWWSGANVGLFHAVAHDRKQENYPNANIRMLGIHPTVYNLAIEILFLLAAAGYATRRFSDNPINPLNATNICFWIWANTWNLGQAAYDVHHRNDDLPPEVVINLPPERPRVEVMDDDAVEESSSEIVVAAPGTFRP